MIFPSVKWEHHYTPLRLPAMESVRWNSRCVYYCRAFFVSANCVSSQCSRLNTSIRSAISAPMPEFFAWNMYIVARILVWKWVSPEVGRAGGGPRGVWQVEIQFFGAAGIKAGFDPEAEDWDICRLISNFNKNSHQHLASYGIALMAKRSLADKSEQSNLRSRVLGEYTTSTNTTRPCEAICLWNRLILRCISMQLKRVPRL